MTEEPCQCPDCKRFYKEHDRLIREFPTFKHQQELNWASIQSFRTLCSKVSEELQKQVSNRVLEEYSTENEKHSSDLEITDEIEEHSSDLEITNALEELEKVNAYLYSIEALMERIFDIKVSENIESKFKEISRQIAPDPLNIDRLILNRLFHQTPDLPDKNNPK